MVTTPSTAASGGTETRLLFAALRSDASADSWQRDCASSGVDLDRLAVRAVVLGLAPMLLHRLAALGVVLPDRAAAKLVASREAHRQRNQSILVQLGEVLDALHRERVRPISLKGIHLATLVYPEIGLRPMNDIDLLVRPDETTAVARALSALGYTSRLTSPDHGAGVTKHTATFRRPGSVATTPNPYLSPASDRTVEPHTSLEESWLGLRVDVTPGVRDRAVECQIAGRSCRILAAEDLILHLAVHLIFHLVMGRPSMVQVLDLAVVPGSLEVDWTVVARRASKRRAAPYALAGLGLAQRTLAAPVPESLLEALREQSPPTLVHRADSLDLAAVLRRTQQPIAGSLSGRIRHGLADRVAAAQWARDWADRRRIAMTVLAWWRSDTARSLLRPAASR